MRTIPRICGTCKVEFLADPREVNRGNAKYCTVKCIPHLPKQTNTPNTHCAWCDVPLFRKPILIAGGRTFFCSRTHQSLGFTDPRIASTPGPVNRSGKKWEKPPFTCSFSSCPNGSYNYYCQTHARIETQMFNWLSGDSSPTLSSGGQTAHWVKKYIVELRGDRCEVCGFEGRNPSDDSSIIQMDHINGNSQDNDPLNLKLLCPNHHAMTPTYGSRNRGNGRHYRRRAWLNYTPID